MIDCNEACRSSCHKRLYEDSIMTQAIDRRDFLGTAATTGLALGAAALPARAEVKGANDKLVVGIMGTGWRGLGLTTLFERQPNCEVAYVCDVDRSRVEKASQAVNKVKGRTPKTVSDFRRILDDKDVDIL